MKTVYVGLSGGVDSSVAAALLQQQGYRVIGVYMQNWTKDFGSISCPWKTDLIDAKSVAVALGIPFKVFNFETQYKKLVVDYMLKTYRAGLIPNPDIRCNQEIKFKLFLQSAINAGADLIATGHYAKVKNGRLYQAVDTQKDQTYFLYRVTKTALSKTLMPIGDYRKSEVRKLAKKFHLPTANKKDSQGICFVGEVGIEEFLSSFITLKPGNIRLKNDQTIGTHKGAILYTIGQRQGLGIGGGKPYYVIDKNIKKNIIYVTDDARDLKLYNNRFLIKDTHWINKPPRGGINYQIRLRHQGDLIDGKVIKQHGELKIMLTVLTRAITPGQSAVIYHNEEVLGGGIICV